MTVLGKGTPSYAFAATRGTVRHFTSPSDVIDSIDSDLESTIALVESGGTTFLSPILGRLGGIICRDGTLRSHLAIVSREFEVPCLLGVDLTGDIADGTELVLDVVDGTGLVRTRDDAGAGATRPAATDTSIPMRTQGALDAGGTRPAAPTDGPSDGSATTSRSRTSTSP
jgi:phosphohistidine swiveling domain-containing protein